MSNVIPINSRAIAAAAIRAKLREAANASGRLGSLEDTIDLIRYECDRFAWLAPPAEKGKSRKLTVFKLNNRNQEFESTPLRHTVWHASLHYGEAMKSARGARFTRGRGRGECQRQRLSVKIA